MARIVAKGLRLRVTAIVLGLAIGGLLSELCIRAYVGVNRTAARVVAESDPMHVLIAAHGELGYRPRPNSVFRYGNGTVATTNSMGYRGPVVGIPKPSCTFRILLLGESTTHGWGVADDQTIDA